MGCIKDTHYRTHKKHPPIYKPISLYTDPFSIQPLFEYKNEVVPRDLMSLTEILENMSAHSIYFNRGLLGSAGIFANAKSASANKYIK